MTSTRILTLNVLTYETHSCELQNVFFWDKSDDGLDLALRRIFYTNHVFHIHPRRSCTTRKHCEKEPQSFPHCGSFDHPDRQSLNDCRFGFFHLPTEIAGSWGLAIYRWRILINTFSNGVLHAPKILKLQSQHKKEKQKTKKHAIV